MSHQTIERAYECMGCGPYSESHTHTLSVLFNYTSDMVRISEEDRVFYLDWTGYEALKSIFKEEEGNPSEH